MIERVYDRLCDCFFEIPEHRRRLSSIAKVATFVRFTRDVIESANTNANMNANNMHIIALFDKFI